MTKPAFSHCAPFLPVKDLHETIAFYRDRLGFHDEWFWNDTDAGIRRDSLRMLFMRSPEHVAAINGNGRYLEVCVFVQNVDALHDELVSKGVPIHTGLADEPWGMREFSIIDPNGYRLRIGQGIG